MNTWFTGDTHFGHENLCLGVSKWKDRLNECRDFKTLEEMNETIVANINDNVGENDTLFHLGDWAMGGIANISLFRDLIKCKNIHLILGNHDKHISKKPELQKLFTSVQTTWGWPDGKKIGGTRFMMCHFPMFVWDRHMHGAIHLHGHCHGNLQMPGMNERKILDVGMDNHPEFRPFHIDEVKKMMNHRGTVNVDHHTEDTTY